MRKSVSVTLVLLGTLVVAAAGGIAWLRRADAYRQDGTLVLPGLSAPVRVVRDGQGVPYIFAATLDDALRAQGFVTAQDRLFQIEFSRYLSHGRLAELIGEPGLESDIQVRVAGVPRHARRHAAQLEPAERRRRELYLEGLNAYIRDHADEHPVALRLLGIEPQPWTVEDSVTLSWFLNWSSSANLDAELISQGLVDRLGPQRAATLTQVTVNPDDGVDVAGRPAALQSLGFDAPGDGGPFAGSQPVRLGSNNWVVAGARTTSGMPIVANDPHLDSRTLPGIWHPVALVTPGLRAVGVGGAGVPGLAIARTDRIAYGVTNSYGDVIDLFVERPDPARPGHYLEGDASYPFEVIEDTIRVRNRPGGSAWRDVPLRIRLTHRGPVISDHGFAPGSDALISLRWAPAEAMRPDDSGGTELMLARSVEEAREVIGRVNAPYNYVVADVDGHIARLTGGRVPVRLRGDGSSPVAVVDGADAWGGMIPPAEMPAVVDPARGWLGNANHRVLPADYPHAYSTYFASSWRYRRIVELIDGAGRLGAVEHWRFMWDTKNLLAAEMAPVMAAALAAHEDTRDMAEVLAGWNAEDGTGLAAPTVFQATWREFARLTVEDELGAPLAARLLARWYYWQERLLRLSRTPDDAWFDDVATPARETRDDILHRAALAARGPLEAELGRDPREWRWGRVHTVTFASPVVPGAFAARWLGGGTRPKDGSGETLNRAIFAYDKPFATKTIASMRFLADLADGEKVMAVVGGGVSGRQFDPHLADQLDAWESGEPNYWWFSDAAIAAHARHELRLEP